MGSRVLTAKRVEAFLGRLSEFVDALPSAESKAEIDRELEALIHFLMDFRRRLNSLPTSDDAAGLETSIESLRHYVRIAEADPLISRVLGLQKQAKKSKKVSPRNRVEVDVEHAIAELNSLQPEEMRQRLADKRTYTVAVLRRIAAGMGVRVPSTATRSSITEQLVKRAGNLAGYEYLRGNA